MEKKRLERRKNRAKKIASFLEIAKLNDQDKEVKKMRNCQQKIDNSSEHEHHADGKADEPCPKRQKINDETPSSQHQGHSWHPQQRAHSSLVFPPNQQTPPKPPQESGIFECCENFRHVNNLCHSGVCSPGSSVSFPANQMHSCVSSAQNQPQSSVLLNPQNVNLLRNQAYINLIWNYLLKHNQVCLPLAYLSQQPLAGYPQCMYPFNSRLVDFALPKNFALSYDRQNHKVEDVQLTNTEKKPPLAEQDLAELRKQLKERFKAIKKMPIFRLRDSGETASLLYPEDKRVPLFFADIQHLLMFVLLGKNSPFTPSRWCCFTRSGHVSAFNVVFIEGVNVRDCTRFSADLDALSCDKFQHQVEVVMPSAYCGSLVEELVAVPLSADQQSNLLSSYGTLDAALKASGEVFRVLRAIFPVQHQGSSKENSKSVKELEIKLPPSDKFPRTHLLLSAWQMIEENYPMPMNNSLRAKYHDYVRTKDIYTEVTPFSPMYGLDCEMCITCTGKSELARISIVNEKLEAILDTLVLPYNKITNYVTHYSGITREMMKGVTTRLEDVQKIIRDRLEPDAILVGQSLNFDLAALKMMHPYCIDTSVIFNISGDRYRKSKLRDLARQFLQASIQVNGKGHCSVEDSSACLRLVQLKLSKGIEFGDAVLSNLCSRESKSQESKQSTESGSLRETEKGLCTDRRAYATSLFSYAVRGEKNTTIVGTPRIIEEYVDYLNPKITTFEQADGKSVSSVSTHNQAESSSGTKHVSCVISTSNEVSVEEAVKRSSSNSCTITQIRLTEEERESLAEGRTDVVKRINEWIKKVYDTTQQNGMCIVILCGRDASSNGACFIHLRTSEIKDFHFEPKFSPEANTVTS